MKPLKPSHRENKRYLYIAGKDASKKAIEEIILEHIGIIGFSKTAFQTIKYSQDKIIISINREMLDEIRVSLLLSGKDVSIKKVSGSVSNLKGFL